MFEMNSIFQAEVRLEKDLHAFLGGTELHETICVDNYTPCSGAEPRVSARPGHDSSHHQCPRGPYPRVPEGW